MVLNTGLRTDIPAFYSDWFYARLREGSVHVRNPYRPEQVTVYRLSPDVVDCIAFCTKNPAPMLARLGELNAYRQFWYVTITPYGAEIEPGVPPVETVIDSFRQLSKTLGPHAVGWRYDPIFLNATYSLARHIEAFSEIASALRGYTAICVISFIDLYAKTKRNFPGIEAVSKADQIQLIKSMVSIAAHNGMALKTCAEEKDLAYLGVDCGGCLTADVLSKAIGVNLRPPENRKGRAACDCLLSADIGAYNTCPHLCRYCYANFDRQTVLQNRSRHDPTSPFLIGHAHKGDIVRQARQESWIDLQTPLF